MKLPRDGTPRGKFAVDLEDMAVKVLNEAERQINEAYRMGFIEGYLRCAEDDDEEEVVTVHVYNEIDGRLGADVEEDDGTIRAGVETCDHRTTSDVRTG